MVERIFDNEQNPEGMILLMNEINYQYSFRNNNVIPSGFSWIR